MPVFSKAAGMEPGDMRDQQPVPDEPVRRYANHLSVHFSLSEVELRFGQCVNADTSPAVHSLVVSSPTHLVTFGRAIQASIAHYETRFGRLPDAGE